MPEHTATVTEIEELAPSVVQLTVAFNDQEFRFEPGQWVNFGFPEGVSRAYTIASAPHADFPTLKSMAPPSPPLTRAEAGNVAREPQSFSHWGRQRFRQ